MKVFTSAVRVKSKAKNEELNITGQVEAVILESGVHDGMALVFTGHTTASIHLNNVDKDLEEDFHAQLSEMVPARSDYKHNKGDYGKNADAHIKSVITGHSVTVPITKGRIVLGQWQGVYFSEFDGPRSRLISIKVFGTGQDGQ